MKCLDMYFFFYIYEIMVPLGTIKELSLNSSYGKDGVLLMDQCISSHALHCTFDHLFVCYLVHETKGMMTLSCIIICS